MDGVPLLELPLLDEVPLEEEVSPSAPPPALDVDEGGAVALGVSAEGTAGGWAICCCAQPASHVHEAKMATITPDALQAARFIGVPALIVAIGMPS